MYQTLLSFTCVSSFNLHNNAVRCRPCIDLRKSRKETKYLEQNHLVQSSLAVYYNARYIIRARPKENFGLAGNIEAHAWSLDSRTGAATYWLWDLGQVTCEHVLSAE